MRKYSVLKYIGIFLGSTLLKLDGYISLYERITDVTPKPHEISLFVEIVKFLAVPLFITAVFIYFDIKFNRQKRSLKKYVDNLAEIHQQVNMMMWQVEERKRDYLFRCIQQGKILDEPVYLSPYEEQLLDDIFSSKMKKYRKLKSQLTGKFKDNKQPPITP